uniref:Succinate dehydrogenase assembly factor 4, mitochondrial n=2 Tax=Solanum tuberosum TaxID=4113 RepID=M1AIJ8_SOLTU
MGHLLKSLIELPVSKVGFSKNSASRLICSSTQGGQIKHDHPGEHEVAHTLDEKEKVDNKNEGNLEVEDDSDEEDTSNVNKKTGEIGGPKGPEPTRYGDWERGGRCSDF